MLNAIFAQAGNIAPIEEKTGIFHTMQRGGPLMLVLFVCAVVAAGVFFERMFYYKRCRMNVSEFLAGVLALVRRQSFQEAIIRCEEGHGPIVSVVRTAIYKKHLPPVELREVVREIAQLEIPHLEANISLLGTIGYVAPPQSPNFPREFTRRSSPPRPASPWPSPVILPTTFSSPRSTP